MLIFFVKIVFRTGWRCKPSHSFWPRLNRFKSRSQSLIECILALG